MDEPCKDCMNAGELGDKKTWVCLEYSGVLANGQLYIQLIDENTDWEKCEKYVSPEDIAELHGEEEEEDEDGEEVDD